ARHWVRLIGIDHQFCTRLNVLDRYADLAARPRNNLFNLCAQNRKVCGPCHAAETRQENCQKVSRPSHNQKPMIHTKRILLLFAISIFAAIAVAQDPDYGVKTHLLKNGMKILVQEDHSIPSVALYIFYRIGSRNERPGTTGLSHFFEHMMFNGAKKYGP